jgi:5-aminolevulinate synthase
MSVETVDSRVGILADFDTKIAQIQDDHLYRDFLPLANQAAERGFAMHKGRLVQVWCSNDYLGMSQHADVISRQMNSVRMHGVGSGGSRNIAGSSVAHGELEARLAAWHAKERALLFSSGYVANFETLSTLISSIDGLVVFSDALNHRSLIEGIVRSTKAKHVFAHNNVYELERLLAKYDVTQPKLIVFESVYSMDGDTSPVSEIFDLAERYQALTYLDETHAIGVRGPSGAGLCEELGDNRATFVQGVFGKSIGTVGGYVAGPDAAVDYVRSHAPGFIFTTSLPQATIDATLTSLDIVQSSSELRAAVHRNVAEMKFELRARDIEFLDTDSHLVPVMVRGGERVRRVAKVMLERHDIYVQPINFPSVARGDERFRITVAPFRTSKQIANFAESLKDSLAQA